MVFRSSNGLYVCLEGYREDMSQAGMERQGKSSVWTGIGSDGKIRTTTIHSKHTGNVGPGLVNEIAKKQLYFNSVEEMYKFLKD